jgi:hypothetical protein
MSNLGPSQPKEAGAPSLRAPFSAGVGDNDANPDRDEPSSGISLTLVYSLLAVALMTAIAIALFIVLPFYHRR